MERILHDFLNKPNAGLRFTRERQGDAAVFHCHGAFSLSSATDLNAMASEILDEPAKRIVLDMLEVTQIDSTGVGTLATIFKEARASARELRIVPSAVVREALVTIRIHTLLPAYDTVEDALRP